MGGYAPQPDGLIIGAGSQKRSIGREDHGINPASVPSKSITSRHMCVDIPKSDGAIVGLWPGTCLHAARTLAHPRWEDYDYTPLDKTSNRLYWLGDGMSYNEKTMTGDRTSFTFI